MMDKYTAQASTIEEAIQKALKELAISREEADIQIIEEGKKGFLGFGQKDAVVTVSRTKTQSIAEEFLSQTDLTLDSYPTSEEAITSSESAIKDAEPESELKVKVPEKEEHAEISEITETDDEKAEKMMLAGKKDAAAISNAATYIQTLADHMGASPVSVYVKQEGVRVTFTIDTEKAGIVIGRHGKVLNALQALVQVLLHKEAASKLIALVDVEDYRDRREEALEKLAERTSERVIRTKRSVTLEPMPAHERKMIHHFLSRNAQVTTHSEGKEPHRYLVVDLAKKKD